MRSALRLALFLLLAARAAGMLAPAASTRAPARPCASVRLAPTAPSRCMRAPSRPGCARLRVRCSAAGDADADDASKLSSEFSRFVTPRVRLTQAWPVRVVTSAAADLRRSLRSVTRFYSGALDSTPAHWLMLAVLLVAYAAQMAGASTSATSLGVAIFASLSSERPRSPSATLFSTLSTAT